MSDEAYLRGREEMRREIRHLEDQLTECRAECLSLRRTLAKVERQRDEAWDWVAGMEPCRALGAELPQEADQ